MRERIKKSRTGRRASNSDLRINVYNISGANFLTVMFYGDSHEKITDGKYIALEVDRERHSLYFVPADSTDGFKLVQTRAAHSKNIRIRASSPEDWAELVGNYNLQLDATDNSYYIDYHNKLQKE